MFTSQDLYIQGHRSAKLMESQGGFAAALASAYYKADQNNCMKLMGAFPELFKQVELTKENT
jgi:2-oxo-4-hydroxy-4-carboxy--5-ureidoimidazoline (OHCU) decarboxylase